MSLHYYKHYILSIFAFAFCAFCCPRQLQAQNVNERLGNDTIHADNLVEDKVIGKSEQEGQTSVAKLGKHKRDWSTWKPDAKRALWLAIVMPGAGQIYNRKYWKLPIIYGGFVGCAYALRWNNMMYRDYSQAYLDIMDNDPNTQSYNQFLHLGTQITTENQQNWQEVFRKRKDRYRRWRDLSFFVMVGVYALSVVDAYVDASLSEFDISPDLSFHFSPTVINSSDNGQRAFSKPAIGLQCGLTF